MGMVSLVSFQLCVSPAVWLTVITQLDNTIPLKNTCIICLGREKLLFNLLSTASFLYRVIFPSFQVNRGNFEGSLTPVVSDLTKILRPRSKVLLY